MAVTNVGDNAVNPRAAWPPTHWALTVTRGLRHTPRVMLKARTLLELTALFVARVALAPRPRVQHFHHGVWRRGAHYLAR